MTTFLTRWESSRLKDRELWYPLQFVVGGVHLLLPLASGVDDDGEHHAHGPGEHGAAEEGGGLSVGVGLAAGQVSQEVSHGDPDHG